LNPYTYQQKLIDKAKVSNDEAEEILIKAFKDGKQIVMESVLEGPYMSYYTYWISDGTAVLMDKPSNLHWVGADIFQY
jgi:hypothetical protein